MVPLEPPECHGGGRGLGKDESRVVDGGTAALEGGRVRLALGAMLA